MCWHGRLSDGPCCCCRALVLADWKERVQDAALLTHGVMCDPAAGALSVCVCLHTHAVSRMLTSAEWRSTDTSTLLTPTTSLQNTEHRPRGHECGRRSSCCHATPVHAAACCCCTLNRAQLSTQQHKQHPGARQT